MIRVLINGNVVRDPETRAVTSKDGPITCTTFTVASNDRKGEATFIRVTAWRKLAEICFQYIRKGDRVCVSADNIRCSSYTGNDGATHTTIDVNAEAVDLPAKRAGSESDDTPHVTQTTQQKPAQTAMDIAQRNIFQPVVDDGLPF